MSIEVHVPDSLAQHGYNFTRGDALPSLCPQVQLYRCERTVGPPENMRGAEGAALGQESMASGLWSFWLKRYKPHLRRKFLVLAVYSARI